MNALGEQLCCLHHTIQNFVFHGFALYFPASPPAFCEPYRHICIFLSQQSNCYSHHAYTRMQKNSPQNTPSALHTNLLPFWAAGSTSCSWIAADQMLAAGWLSSNTAKFICLWFFSLPSKDRRQKQTRLAWANLKLSWQQQQEGKAAQ